MRNEAESGHKGKDIKKISDIRKAKIVDEIKEYFYSNYSQKISMKDVSQTLYLSPPYISLLFKKQTGYTPIEFLNRVRIDKAKNLLAAGETDFAKVADSIGINSIHYFYRVFKILENMTPVDYLEHNP